GSVDGRCFDEGDRVDDRTRASGGGRRAPGPGGGRAGARRGAGGARVREAPDVAPALGADVRQGLTSVEAASRLRRHGSNELDAETDVPVWRKVLRQFADPLIYLLLGAVVVSLVAWVIEGSEGVPFEAIVIVVIVVLNAGLGYGEEARADQA